ncbi:unnamed protein product [Prorocentrum cordatum]|uniref:Uncharacterized protein n=1 Tax=Prorocentrum cordatum TaxID=2364126 RepID=A0ABN9Q6C4_9DINO|nr:unnamed protein product [Polarella glacialis]
MVVLGSLPRMFGPCGRGYSTMNNHGPIRLVGKFVSVAAWLSLAFLPSPHSPPLPRVGGPSFGHVRWTASRRCRPARSTSQLSSLGSGPPWSGGPPWPERPPGAPRTAPGLAAATSLLPEELLRGAPRTEPLAKPPPRPESAGKPVSPVALEPRSSAKPISPAAREPRSVGSPEAALADDLRQLEEWAAKLRESARS